MKNQAQGPYPEGLEFSAFLLWGVLVLAVLSMTAFRVRDLRQGDRAQARLFLLEDFWRSHRRILKLIFRLRGNR